MITDSKTGEKGINVSDLFVKGKRLRLGGSSLLSMNSSTSRRQKSLI